MAKYQLIDPEPVDEYAEGSKLHFLDVRDPIDKKWDLGKKHDKRRIASIKKRCT